MTIKQAAEKYGISVQAIYSRLKKNGISLETLKDADTGELTADAMAVFDKLFDKENREKRESFNSTIERLQGEVNRLNKENSSLLEKIKQVEAANAELKQERERLLTIAQQAQELHKAALERLLPPPVDNTAAEGQGAEGQQVKRGGLFTRLFGRK
jgi:septal ring factor EnvC (AmiA/AmiB activator)